MGARDEFLSRLARAATPQDWDVVREAVNEEAKRRCFLIYDQCEHLGSVFNATRTAKILGVSSKTISRWIKELEAMDKTKRP